MGVTCQYVSIPNEVESLANVYILFSFSHRSRCIHLEHMFAFRKKKILTPGP